MPPLEVTLLGELDLQIKAPILKAEPQPDGRLLVEGIAVSEDADATKEVMDYETSKSAALAWRGNLREQHDPKKAVGHAIEVLPDDTRKAVYVKAFVSKGAPDTQAKVLDGTLSFFSIGGKSSRRVAEKADNGDMLTRVYLERISEVSLVDSGCNPATSVSVVKTDGAGNLVTVDLDEEVKVEPWAPGAVAEDGLPENVDKADESKAKEPYGNVTYADPGYQADKKKRYPIDTAEHIRAAWNYISKPKNAGKYSGSQAKQIKRRIVAAWKKKIDKAGPPSAKEEKSMKKFDAEKAGARFLELATRAGISPDETTKADVVKVGFDPWGYAWNAKESTNDALQALYAMTILEQLAASEDAEGEEDQASMLEDACGSIADYIIESMKESHGPAAAEPTAKVDDPPAPVAKVEEAPGITKSDVFKALNDQVAILVKADEARKAEFDTFKADHESQVKALGEERDTLREQVTKLEGQMTAIGSRIVEAGGGQRRVVKGGDPGSTGSGSGSLEDMTQVLMKVGGPELVQKVVQEAITQGISHRQK